jgi:hypothetical protein
MDLLPGREGSSQVMALTTHLPSSVKVKERVQLYLYLPLLWAFMACNRMKFTFTMCYNTALSHQ